MNVLLVYATKKGSTQEIAEAIADILQKSNHTVTVAHCDTVTSPAEYDAVIIGTGIYKGKWLPAAETFLRKFDTELRDKPLFYFLVCIRVLEADGYDHVMQEYIPTHLLNPLNNIQGAVAFAGKLSYQDIDWHDEWTLSVRYDGQEDPLTKFVEDHRDWDAIQAWAETIASQIQ